MFPQCDKINDVKQIDLVHMSGIVIHMIGIKGTGMTSLAVALKKSGAIITGSDVPEVFYTDALLAHVGMTSCSGFSPEHIPENCEFAVTSSAYTVENNSELAACVRLGIPVVSYIDIVASLTRSRYTCAVAGTHGKSSTSAMIDFQLDCLGENHISLYGTSYISSKNVTPVQNMSHDHDPIVCIEACEYRDHFLAYHPDCIVLTSIGYDHPDYFSDLAAVIDSFVQFVERLPSQGILICHGTDSGVQQVCRRIAVSRPDIVQIPYGRETSGPYGIVKLKEQLGGVTCTVRSGCTFKMRIPGGHMAENMVAAAVAVKTILGHLGNEHFTLGKLTSVIPAFCGAVRRVEFIGRCHGITVVDDYGHHPVEIRVTIEGLRNFYHPKRVVVDFIPHTFARTQSLFTEFVEALNHADVVIIHPLYVPPREIFASFELSAEQESRKLVENLDHGLFLENDDASLKIIPGLLKSGDLFITMGAGNNRRTGSYVLKRLENKE